MTDCINRPPFEEIRDQIKSEMSALVLSGRPVRAKTTLNYLAEIMGGVAFQVWGDVQKSYGQFFLPTMCCDTLLAFSKTIGLPPKPAMKAQGYVKITGTPGASVPAGLEVVSLASQQYAMDASVPNPIVFDGQGEAIIFVRALVPGRAGNLAHPSTLTTAAAYPATNSTVQTVGDGMTCGANEETCDELRERLISHRQNACVAGNLAFYRQAILSFPGVTRVCFSGCACSDCCDSPLITAYPFMDAVYPRNYGIPTRSVLLQIQKYVFGDPMGRGVGLAPVGAYGQMLSGQPCQVNVRLHALRTINPTTRDLISQAIRTYFASRSCVGETLCMSDLAATINAAIGQNCFARISVTGTCVELIDDGAFARMSCGTFPILGTLSFLTT